MILIKCVFSTIIQIVNSEHNTTLENNTMYYYFIQESIGTWKEKSNFNSKSLKVQKVSEKNL